MIGKLVRVKLRDVFPHETSDLSKWLAENPDVIEEATGRKLSINSTEDPIGSFYADITGEDENGDIVIIENQLAKSDHDHLGKLITYVAGREARTAIWIVAYPRPEHTDAINWLNEANLCAFFLLKLEAVQIGDSDPAPLLTLITGPSEELIKSGESKKDSLLRHTERTEFWELLLPNSNEKTALFKNVSAGPYNNLWAGSGTPSIGYQYKLTQNSTGVELYFDLTDPQENLRTFNIFSNRSDEINAKFGGPLKWDEMSGRKAARVRFDLNLGGYRSDVEQWPEIINQTVDAMCRLEGATRPILQELSA